MFGLNQIPGGSTREKRSNEIQGVPTGDRNSSVRDRSWPSISLLWRAVCLEVILPRKQHMGGGVCQITGQETMFTRTELTASLGWGLGSADMQIQRQNMKGLDSGQKTICQCRFLGREVLARKSQPSQRRPG